MTEDYANDRFKAVYGLALTDAGQERIRAYRAKYGGREVCRAVDIVCEQYEDAVTAFDKLPGVLYRRRETLETMFMEVQDAED